MTKKKQPREVVADIMADQLKEAKDLIFKQQEEIRALKNPKDAYGGQEPAPRHATPGGPNFPTDIYPPGCGPMQLVWAAGTYGSCVLGWQCDSFRMFESRQNAADWLREQARRIETWDKEIASH